MRESEHFNLNLVEGTDIVNPLVTDVPNYESIDAQMFKNQNAGVQNATELKNGTIHAITRLVPDAQMITFTATSNFVAGDTFTVDGIQVSALTVSGEQLPTGAYVINSQVLAILKGTLLTVYGIGSDVADNALALNGHPDTYFGTKDEVDNAINTANASASLAESVANKGLKLLWENLNPNTDFEAQNIVLNSSDYDYLMIFFKRGVSSEAGLNCEFTLKGKATSLHEITTSTSSYITVNTRTIAYTSDTVLSASDNQQQRTGSIREKNNSATIPYSIYGGKF